MSSRNLLIPALTILGLPEIILDPSSYILKDGKEKPLTEKDTAEVLGMYLFTRSVPYLSLGCSRLGDLHTRRRKHIHSCRNN